MPAAKKSAAKKTAKKKPTAVVAKKSAKTSKAATAKPAAKKKPAAKTSRASKKDTHEIGGEVKINDADKVLCLVKGELAAGSVVKSTSKAVTVVFQSPNGEKQVELDRDAVLVVRNPNGLKTPEKFTMGAFAGEGFFTDAGQAYYARNKGVAVLAQSDEVHVGDMVRVNHLPFGYFSKDACLTVGREYMCIGYLGEMVITNSDVEDAPATFHQDLVTLTARWKKAA